MTEETPNERLPAKMEHEQGWLLSHVIDAEQFPALSMGRRYFMQDAILLALQDKPIPEEQAAALLCSGTPLEDVFLQWVPMEEKQAELLHQAIRVCADSRLSGQKKNDQTDGGTI